jgi:hypothetical protein
MPNIFLVQHFATHPGKQKKIDGNKNIKKGMLKTRQCKASI